MSEKINLIAKKIYEEGLEKAQSESAKILEEAESKSQEILDKARKEANQIIENAKKSAEKDKAIVNSEIKLAGNQMLDTIQQRIKNILSDKALESSMAKAFEDPDFIKGLILELVSNWKGKGEIELKLDDKTKSKIEESLKKSLKPLLKDLEISKEGNIKTGFIIRDKGENYEIEFTPEQFRAYLKPFIKESTHKLIFS